MQTRKKKIDGIEYSILQMSPKNFQRVLRRCSPVLELLGVLTVLEAKDMIGGAAIFGEAVTKFFRAMSDEDFDTICDLCCENAEYTENGRTPSLSTPGVFDAHFAGHQLRLYKFLWFVITANNEDFSKAWEHSKVRQIFQATATNYQAILETIQPLIEILADPRIGDSMPILVSYLQESLEKIKKQSNSSSG